MLLNFQVVKTHSFNLKLFFLIKKIVHLSD